MLLSCCISDHGGYSQGNRNLLVRGWPTFDAYGVDYGWGRPQMLYSKWRDGGVEIVMWRGRVKMNAFAAIFDRGLIVIIFLIHSNLGISVLLFYKESCIPLF